MMNSVTLVGSVVDATYYPQAADRRACLILRVDTPKPAREWQGRSFPEVHCYHRCLLFSSLAEAMREVKAGDCVAMQGEIQYSSRDIGGQILSSTDIYVQKASQLS